MDGGIADDCTDLLKSRPQELPKVAGHALHADIGLSLPIASPVIAFTRCH